MALEYVSQIISDDLNQTMQELTANGINYSDLVLIQKDNQGNVVMVQSNTMAMNNLALNAGDNAQKRMENLKSDGLYMPFGYFVGGQFLGDAFFDIRLNFEQISNVSPIFSSTFEEAGINQTIHRINLTLETKGILMLPNHTQEFTVSLTIPLCETVIIGNVPSGFLDFQ